MDKWLKASVSNSERKGYHRRGMDFSRVQRSGVSAILRKGESVSASATIRRVRLEEVWRWGRRAAAANGPADDDDYHDLDETLFLDASCLTYGFDGKPLAEIDFSHRRSVSGLCVSGDGVYGSRGSVAITHSGDVIDGGRREGKHTINVNLHALSDKVGSLYLTLSAWTTSLTAIVRPEVRCYDPDDKSDEPLARYELDGKPTHDSTAVVMARIWRPKPGGRWQVTAIGELGMGRASNYKPIHETIARLNLHAGKASRG
jgi:stress response protein SCP2